MAGAGVNLATAFVPVVPSMRGIQASLTKQVLAPAASAGRSSGRSWGQKFGTAVKIGAGVAAGGAAAVVGTALVKGFQRLTAIETATAKLKGLGNSSKDVKVIMAGALKSVKGTAFGMDSAATAAAGAVAAGIKPGKQLNRVLGSMANSAAAAGVPMEEMGSIYNKVASLGKAQNDSLQQVADKGIPIYQALGDQLGVTGDEVFKMASEGKISFAMFEKAMKTASGTVAGELGKTTQGTLANLNAAMGRLGAGLLAGTFPKIQPLLASVIGVVDKLTVAAGPAAEAVGSKLAPAMGAVTKWLDGLNFTSWSNFTASLGGGGVSASLSSLWNSTKNLAPAFSALGASLAAAGPQFSSLASSGINILATGLQWLANHMDTIVKWLPAIVGGFMLWRAATSAVTTATALNAYALAYSNTLRIASELLAFRTAAANRAASLATVGNTAATNTNNAAQNVGLFTRIRTTAALVAQRVAIVATSIATRAAAVGQWLLNAAMSANPIGLIIIGITALVAGLVWFFTQTKLGQAIITTVWAGIKLAIGSVVTWFTTVMVPWFTAAWNNILGAVKFVWNWVKTNWPLILGFITGPIGMAVVLIVTHWNSIKAFLFAGWNWIKAYVFTPIKNFVMITIPKAFNFLVSMVRLYINVWKLILSTAWKFVKAYVFNPIRNFVMITIPNAFRMFVNYIRSSIEGWKRILSFAWTFVRVMVFNPIRRFVTVTIPNAFRTFVNYVRDRMGNFKTNIHSAWAWVKNHTFNPLKNFITSTIPNAFKTGVSAIGKFWDKLKSVASKPVKFVVDTVYNKGLRKMWNPIAGFIGKDNWKLKEVDVSKFRSGGKVWGPGTETSDSIPARLSKNEHVLSAKDVKNLGGHGNVYALRNAASRGWTPGLATGGTLSDAARWLQSKGARITEFGAWGQRVGKHSDGSKHYTGNAFDSNYGPGGQNATETNFFNRVVPEMKKLFPKLGYIWRSPTLGHFDHLHVDTGGGGSVGTGGGGGGGGWIPGLDKMVDWVKDKLGGIGSGRVAEGMTGMTTKLIDGMADKVRSVFDVFGGGGGGGSTAGASQDVVAAVRDVAKGYGWDTGQQWKSLRWIVDKESGWDPNAANPTSSARGLFQKMTSVHGPVEGTPAGQARWGLKYIKGRYQDPIGAQAFHRGHGYYANGGPVLPASLSMMSGLMPKPTLFDGGGRLTDQMVAIHGKSKPDAVLTDSQWNDMHTIARSSSAGNGRGDVTVQLIVQGNIDSRDTADYAIDKLGREVNRIFRGGRYVGK